MDVRTKYHNELRSIFDEVITMGERVTKQLNAGLDCLEQGDEKAARMIIKKDEDINAMEMAIEDRCVLILAKESPVATELREIVTVMKITSELERLGDHAKHLAENAGSVNKAGLKIAVPMFRDMVSFACQMVKEALEAFVELDTTWAEEIAGRDRYIDEKYIKLQGKLVNLIKDKPNKTETLVPLLILNRHLERIGDRVTNICEYAIYSKHNKHVDLN